MQKVFWDNPYQHVLQTSVTFVSGNEIRLAETIAYSFSGGQESDRAYINKLEVAGSRMEGPFIYYMLPDSHGLCIGQTVEMTIDWPRRYRLMRLHFAAELVLEIVTQKFHLEKIGAHIGEFKARIDFRSDENISPLFATILEEYNAIITRDQLIETGYTDEGAQRRYWKIDGFAQVPCGGTHVKSTAEVGEIFLKRSRPGKAVERIEIKLQQEAQGISSALTDG